MKTRKHIKKAKNKEKHRRKNKNTRKNNLIRAIGRKLLNQISNSTSESIRTMN